MDEAAAVPDRPRSAAGRSRNGAEGRVPGEGTGRIEDALTAPLVEAVRDLDGYGGLVYLRSRDRRSLVLAMITGVPRSLLKSWWRVPVGGALPMAEAYRRDETLWLPDEHATMVRFPHFTAGLPYSFGSAYQPVRTGGETVGVLVVLRSAARAPMDGEAVGAALRPAERAMEERLDRLVAGRPGPGSPAHHVEYDDEPISVRLPTSAAHPVRVGLIDWDLDSDRCTADDDALALLGLDRAAYGGTIADVEARVSPDDLHELRESRHDALADGRVRSRHFRVRDESRGEEMTGYRPVELWGHLVRGGTGSARILVGALVDAGGGLTAAGAAERLPDGLFSLDQDGRLTYANRRCEELLGSGREDLFGRYPWEVVTWLRDPAYEDRYRAAMLSQEQVSFLVRRPDGNWLSFVLYPDVHGLTGRVFPTGPPTGAEPEPEAGSGSAPRLTAVGPPRP
ncbi:PAS domain-containing protein, partial [Streptomyces sp. NPDC002130]|uniref:PAS domain-containing protein n=1 Tax=Streptomyces sp. NPDC002130 TaxID=3155568 RepID=UPI003333D49A